MLYSIYKYRDGKTERERVRKEKIGIKFPIKPQTGDLKSDFFSFFVG